MRRFLATMMMALLPATLAFGQFADNTKNNDNDEPDAAQPGEDAGPGPRGPVGPPPNVMFTAIDADGDGTITKRELGRAVAQLKKLDVDKDGNLTLAEVSPRGGPLGPGAPGDAPAPLIDGVMQNDRNGDGKLTAREIPDHLKPMLATADQNNDGSIDRAELTAAMANMGNQFPAGPGGWGPGGNRGPGGFNQAFDPARMTGQLLQNDRNGDGRLTQDEVPPQAMGMLQGGDQNNDGAIDPAELQAAIQRMGDRARAFRAGAGPGNERNGARTPARTGRGRERPRDEN